MDGNEKNPYLYHIFKWDLGSRKRRFSEFGKVETPDKIATLVAERQLKNLQNKRILSFTPKLLMLP